MKTIGEQAKEFRLAKGWNSTRMAKEVGTSRQNIEKLEEVGGRRPSYIVDLARAMGVTVDDLMTGKFSAEANSVNENLALVKQAPAAINGTASLEQSLEGLAAYLETLDATDRQEVMRMIEVLADHPDRHIKQAAGIRAMVGAPFLQDQRKSA